MRPGVGEPMTSGAPTNWPVHRYHVGLKGRATFASAGIARRTVMPQRFQRPECGQGRNASPRSMQAHPRTGPGAPAWAGTHDAQRIGDLAGGQRTTHHRSPRPKATRPRPRLCLPG